MTCGALVISRPRAQTGDLGFMRPGRVFRAVLSCGLAVWLCACASYAPRPLASGADLAPDIGRLTADVSRLRLAPLKAHRFDPSDGLDPTEVAVLAVLNSPDLAAKRATAKVAAAQAFAAGLLLKKSPDTKR